MLRAVLMISLAVPLFAQSKPATPTPAERATALLSEAEASANLGVIDKAIDEVRRALANVHSKDPSRANLRDRLSKLELRAAELHRKEEESRRQKEREKIKKLAAELESEAGRLDEENQKLRDRVVQVMQSERKKRLSQIDEELGRSRDPMHIADLYMQRDGILSLELISFPDLQFAVGSIGRADRIWQVADVISKDAARVRDRIEDVNLIVRGIDTTGLVDEASVKTTDTLWFVSGTEQYRTVSGTKATVFTVTKITDSVRKAAIAKYLLESKIE